MKKMSYIWLFVFVAFFAGCDDKDDYIPAVFPEATGTVEDNDGNVYRWVRYAGLDWLSSNFRGGMPYYDAPGIDDGFGDKIEIRLEDESQAKEDYKIYGNLYTYAEAVENASMLDDSKGEWRLPTDKDWQKLERALGMSDEAINAEGWRGAPVGALLCQDSTGTDMNFLLGGMVTGAQRGSAIEWILEYVREYGYWWCDDVKESDYTQEGKIVSYRAIRYNTSALEREWCTEGVFRPGYNIVYPRMMSVRYVRDAKN